ncbi:MAG: hypothetical protein NTV70_08300 [Acidobacteria bacterium]|nr:hypothetical protein [Acidobacteriota bacterium]
MKSRTTPAFRKLLSSLPQEARQQATEAYRLFQQDPRHPSLRFKSVQGSSRLVSARINLNFRVVGTKTAPDEVLWFWVGTHAEYERLLANRSA